jgi:hypothetical protein
VRSPDPSRGCNRLTRFRKDRREAVFLYERKDQDNRLAPPITIPPSLLARTGEVIE